MSFCPEAEIGEIICRFGISCANNDSLRQAYAALKEKLAQATPEERQVYSQGKAEFIEAVLRNPVNTA